MARPVAVHLILVVIQIVRVCCFTSCFAFAFVRLRVRELVARPVAAHLLFRVWRLREIDARLGALNFGVGVYCSTECFAVAFRSLTLWELVAQPVAAYLLLVL